MVVMEKFISGIILRIIFTMIALVITGFINFLYCEKTNKEFTFAKFVLIFSVILLCSLPMYFTYVM